MRKKSYLGACFELYLIRGRDRWFRQRPRLNIGTGLLWSSHHAVGCVSGRRFLAAGHLFWSGSSKRGGSRARRRLLACDPAYVGRKM